MNRPGFPAGSSIRNRLPAALQGRDYFLYWSSAAAESFGVNMVAVAIGWQVFSIRHSAFDLGLIGLLEFVPMLLLALPAGQLADRAPRHLVFAAAIGLTAARVAVARRGDDGRRRRAVAVPRPRGRDRSGRTSSPRPRAARSGSPSSPGSSSRARSRCGRSPSRAERSSARRSAACCSRSGPQLVYVVATLLLVAGTIAVLMIHEPALERSGTAPSWSTFLGGVQFIRRTPVMLGAITLDLFAVLFGGAVALLPLFAKQILHTGPVGLGILRSAPAVGALLAGIMLAHRPLRGRTGTTLLVVVAAFGVSMVVFGLSKTLWLSVAALAVSGFVDMISMNIRSTVAAVAAPDELRGRVNAVESVFISASNELGAFESGVAAALIGAVPAVVLGGAATIVLAGVWRWVFPELANIDRIDELRPKAAEVAEAAL